MSAPLLEVIERLEAIRDRMLYELNTNDADYVQDAIRALKADPAEKAADMANGAAFVKARARPPAGPRDAMGYPVDKAEYDREQARLHQEYVWKKRAEETAEPAGPDPRDELIAEAVELFRDVGPAAGHSDRYYRIQAWLARAAALGKGEA